MLLIKSIFIWVQYILFIINWDEFLQEFFSSVFFSTLGQTNAFLAAFPLSVGLWLRKEIVLDNAQNK